MQLTIKFEQREIEAVKAIVEDKVASGRHFVKHRIEKNVNGRAPEIDDDQLWTAHIMCLLTTQQRSGPGSPINRLLNIRPFPMSLELCRETLSLRDYVFQLLTDAKGVRRTNKIAKAAHVNFHRLETRGWDELRRWRDILYAQRCSLPITSHRQMEEAAGDYMDQYLEFGPKQSRNFWQSLGLTRFTFVLDSRIVGWVQRHLSHDAGLLTSAGLGDRQYYSFISNTLLDLCNQAGVLPCVLDAAVFDSFDESTEWTEEVIW